MKQMRDKSKIQISKSKINIKLPNLKQKYYEVDLVIEYLVLCIYFGFGYCIFGFADMRNYCGPTWF
jgi:hypothetical protein